MHQSLGRRVRPKHTNTTAPSNNKHPTRTPTSTRKLKKKLPASKRTLRTKALTTHLQPSKSTPKSLPLFQSFVQQRHPLKNFTARKFSTEQNDDHENNSAVTIQFNSATNTYDPVANSSINNLLTNAKTLGAGAKRSSKQRSDKEKKQNDRLVNTLYGDFVDANDRGDGLAWAGSTDDALLASTGGQENQDDNSTPLHEKILQLYLNNYQEQETRELEAHFEGGRQDDELSQGRDQFLQQIVNSLSPKNYSRFVHSFRLCIQKLRTLLAKHQQQKQHLRDNIHMITNLALQESNLQTRYQTDLQETQITFFRQAAKLFGDQSDVFMPQLVIYLSSLTLTQLENQRERQSTSQMNLYSCGFWSPHDEGGHANPTSSFREQFHTYLEETNPTAHLQTPIPADQVALEAYTFPVRIANKLYADLDIHTDQTSPLFFNKLARTHQRSYKIFVSNIPSTLTTRELMALFGNCGVLNAAEIYRNKLDQNSGSTLESSLNPHSQPGDDTLYQGLSLSKKEAILQANTAALTIDISDIALGHFTSSFKSERLLVPSHVIDGKLIDSAVRNHHEHFQRVLGSDGQPMDPASSIFLQQDGSVTPIDAFSDTIQENFQSELQKFESLHTKRVQRQQRKLSQQQREKEDAEDMSPDLEQQPSLSQHPPKATPHNPLAAYNFKPKTVATNGTSASSLAKQTGSEIDKFKLRNLHSPVYGFLYFATPQGKRRALKQALRVFGVSTASGYAMTTQDALDKNQLIISGLHRSMSGADVAHYVRTTLGDHMSLYKAADDKSFGSTNAVDAQNNSFGDSSVGSIIQRIYVPRSYARSLGINDFFNNNRGYAIVTFDNHESAFSAFRYLQNSTIALVQSSKSAGAQDDHDTVAKTVTTRFGHLELDDDGNQVEKIDSNFSPDSINDEFNQSRTTSAEPTTVHRSVSVHWRQEKTRPQKRQHPITSYFPTFERPKQRLFHKVSEQLKAALPEGDILTAAPTSTVPTPSQM